MSALYDEGGYHRIIIYGMSRVGLTLLEEFRDRDDLEVVAGIDRHKDRIYADCPLFTMKEDIPEGDVVLVTAITAYDKIRPELEAKFACPVLSLDRVIYKL